MLLRSFRFGRQGLLNSLQLKRDANEALRERVVNLSRHPVALIKHRREPRADSVDPQPVHCKPDESQNGRAQSIEPVSLIEVGAEIKLEQRSRLVPHPIIIRSEHVELVAARRHMSVRRDSFAAGVNPVRIKTLQLVLETHLLRSYQTQGGVVKLVPLLARRQLDLGRKLRSISVYNNALECYGGRLAIDRHVLRIYHRKASQSREP